MSVVVETRNNKRVNMRDERAKLGIEENRVFSSTSSIIEICVNAVNPV